MYETVEMLCNKLGVVVEELIPAIAKQCIVSNIIWGVALIALITFCVWWLKIGVKTFKQNEVFDSFDTDFIAVMLIVVAVIVLLVSLILVVACIGSTVEWIVAPKAKAIAYLFNMVS